MARLAFFTFVILREEEGHPQVQGFFDRGGLIFERVEQSDGFIDRSRDDDETGQRGWGERVYPRFFRSEEHSQAATTLSLWHDVESAQAFAYSGSHAESLRHRTEWVLKPEWPTYVAWWVADDHTPNWQEAAERQEHLHDHGPSPHAFDFKHPFGPDGRPAAIDRPLANLKKERNTDRWGST